MGHQRIDLLLSRPTGRSARAPAQRLRLSPYDPLNFWFCTVAGLAEFVAGRYDQAIGWLRKAQRLNHRFSACNRTLAASLALAGEIQAAQTAAQQILSVEPT